MTAVTIATVAHPFGRDLDACLAAIAGLIDDARDRGADLLVLPEAALGGYLIALEGPLSDRPPALHRDGPELARVATMAGDLVVCVGYCEADGAERYNSAACLDGRGLLGHFRKLHQPLGESEHYRSGDELAAFDTPVGRMGMLICYDKAFPEAARTLALDGATVIASLSAWPASRTNPAADLLDDRWTMRFDLFDRARALENQVVWAASNQAGEFGSLRFVGRAKVVGPGGDVLAETGTGPGVACATIDVRTALDEARRSMFHLRDRRPGAYQVLEGAAR
jgi:N-carbamoylputrescine amidase